MFIGHTVVRYEAEKIASLLLVLAFVVVGRRARKTIFAGIGNLDTLQFGQIFLGGQIYRKHLISNMNLEVWQHLAGTKFYLQI